MGHIRQALRVAKLTAFEKASLLVGSLVVLAGVVVAAAEWDIGGAGRPLGSAGLLLVFAYGVSRGLRRYRAGMTAALPASLGRVQVRIRPRRAFSATAVALALGLPAAGVVVVLAVLPWGWSAVASVLLISGTGMFFAWVKDVKTHYEEPLWEPPPDVAELLRRLCMRADMRAPELVVARGRSATAWTAGGRIHLTRQLLELLDDTELEAVLAHELAHLGHRDAAVMEVCSAPSRVLLRFARSVTRRLIWVLRNPGIWVVPGLGWFTFVLAVLVTICAPAAFVVGAISRLSVLGISRSREFAADAAAAALTGRPSALASALLKLDKQRTWTPRADLRAAEPSAVLCIVGTARPRVGRLLSTHPLVAARVKRLEELEARRASRPSRAL